MCSNTCFGASFSNGWQPLGRSVGRCHLHDMGKCSIASSSEKALLKNRSLRCCCTDASSCTNSLNRLINTVSVYCTCPCGYPSHAAGAIVLAGHGCISHLEPASSLSNSDKLNSSRARSTPNGADAARPGYRGSGNGSPTDGGNSSASNKAAAPGADNGMVVKASPYANADKFKVSVAPRRTAASCAASGRSACGTCARMS
mmetsp:Transcript_65751/g.122600  ORF Transcript_65751/g.122600 Transcript_65751/m.122600 type:complete len:201 (+) Transcript_65751:139-741(+)